MLLHLPQVEDLAVRPLGIGRILEGIEYLFERHSAWLLLGLVALRLVDAGRLPHDAVRTCVVCAHDASGRVRGATPRSFEFDSQYLSRTFAQLAAHLVLACNVLVDDADVVRLRGAVIVAAAHYHARRCAIDVRWISRRAAGIEFSK